MEAFGNDVQHCGESCEISIVCCQPPRELPDALDHGQLRAVRRKKEECDLPLIFVQQRRQQSGMMVRGVVEHDDHPPAATSMAQQKPHEYFEGLAIEDWAHLVDEAT